jgi:D-alanyl-D-alanine carboxypeptidase/D-alanyl-D-alanine-endopeptidase (penicillin-binding protein 4)
MLPTLLCLLFCNSVLATPSTWKSKIDQVIKDELKTVNVDSSDFGIWVARGDQSVGHNSTQLMTPASLSKIPTALTVLEKFPLDHKFKTWVYHTGQIKEGVLEGDLYLKGGGDPTFVTESLWLLIEKLKRWDLRKIKGQVYVDESYFDSEYYSNGRQEKRVDRAYDAPVSALSFNWNALSIYIRPGHRVGAAARVYLDPDLPFVEVRNRAKTIRGQDTRLRVDRLLTDKGIVLNVRGDISHTKDEKAFYKSIGDAALWTGEVFKQRLNQAGVRYDGDIKKGVTPATAQLLEEFDSWSMTRVMAALSKFSNNYVAEMLTKHLGKKEGSPANIQDGLNAIVAFLKKNNWKDSEFIFENPSGFTRNNKMRADRLGELLQKAQQNFQLAPEFLTSLPISGTDGTLKSRMKQTMRGKVRAKTGYLTGVVGLAGYLESPQGGEPMIFVFMYNGPYKQDWNVRAMFNRLLWRIYQKS